MREYGYQVILAFKEQMAKEGVKSMRNFSTDPVGWTDEKGRRWEVVSFDPPTCRLK